MNNNSAAQHLSSKYLMHTEIFMLSLLIPKANSNILFPDAVAKSCHSLMMQLQKIVIP